MPLTHTRARTVYQRERVEDRKEENAKRRRGREGVKESRVVGIWTQDVAAAAEAAVQLHVGVDARFGSGERGRRARATRLMIRATWFREKGRRPQGL